MYPQKPRPGFLLEFGFMVSDQEQHLPSDWVDRGFLLWPKGQTDVVGNSARALDSAWASSQSG